METTVSEEQMSRVQEWILAHDKTVKYVAVVMTLIFLLDLLNTTGMFS